MAFPKDEESIQTLLQIWALKAADHKEQFDLTDEILDQVGDDSIVYTHTRVVREIKDDWNAEFSAYKQKLFEGDPNEPIEPFPAIVIPAMPATVNPPKAGIEKRNQELYNFFSNHPRRTESALANLSIIKTTPAPLSPDEVKQVIKAVTVLNEGHVKIKCSLMGYKAYRVLSQRGDSDVFDTIGDSTLAEFTDERPNLVAGQPEKRQYKTICLEGNKPIGSYSATETVITKP
jgi:hypothetical protein